MRALAPPRSTFWVADMSLTSLFSPLKLSLVVALQHESTFSEGNTVALQNNVHMIYTCIWLLYCEPSGSFSRGTLQIWTVSLKGIARSVTATLS